MKLLGWMGLITGEPFIMSIDFNFQEKLLLIIIFYTNRDVGYLK